MLRESVQVIVIEKLAASRGGLKVVAIDPKMHKAERIWDSLEGRKRLEGTKIVRYRMYGNKKVHSVHELYHLL